MKSTYRNIIIGMVVIGLVFGILGFAIKTVRNGKIHISERTNTECLTEERVFDEADILTDEEEEGLRQLIAEKEKECGGDIVLLLLNDPSVAEMADLRDYTQDFYDNNKFGWNAPAGNGVIYADNWAEDSNGHKNCWLCTAGKAKESVSSDDIDDIIDKTCEDVNDDPYHSYRLMINLVAQEMRGGKIFHFNISSFWPFLIALAAAGIFAGVNIGQNKGTDTTDNSTYVKKNGLSVNRKEDQYLRSHVTRRKIEKDSDSGSDLGGTGDFGGGGGYH